MTVGIVTGAGRGMGAACADRVKGLVDALLLVDRDEIGLAAAAERLAAVPGNATVEPRQAAARLAGSCIASAPKVRSVRFVTATRPR